MQLTLEPGANVAEVAQGTRHERQPGVQVRSCLAALKMQSCRDFEGENRIALP